MKILCLSHSASYGGAEKVLCMLLEGLPRDQYEAIVLLPEEGDLERSVRELGVDARQAPLAWWVSYGASDWSYCEDFARGLVERVGTITKMIQEEQIDLVLTNTCVLIEGALAAAMCGVPHVFYVHEMLSQDPLLTPFLPLSDFNSLIAALSQKIVVVSHAVKAELEQFFPSPKIEVIYTGMLPVEPATVQRSKQDLFGVSDEIPVITFAGVLSERKGVVDLADGAPLVLNRFPHARFILAGPDGGKAQQVRKRTRKHGISRAFRFLGFRTDIPDILAASDVIVVPSLADPLPLVVLEAMRAGKPVVATRSGGAAEMVMDGQTGYLVPVQDPPALAESIIALLKDPAERRQMGERGRQRQAEYFGYDRYIDRFQRVFRQAVAESASVSPSGRDLLSGGIVPLLKNLAGQRVPLMRHMAELQGELPTSRRRLAQLEKHPLIGPALRVRRKVLRSFGHAKSA